MKIIHTHTRQCALALSLTSFAFAGDTYVDTPEQPVVTTSEPDAFQWLTPSVDIRTRYEFREQDGFDASNSVTARGRVGLTLGDFNGFSAFGEIEATTALVDDFDAGPGNTTPNEPDQTQIADPENVELNRAWVQYKGNGALAKFGRQRIIRNDAFFVGNVGWRQNEQTYDAGQIAYADDNFSLSYVYSYRVQRIFGDDAGGFVEQAEGDFHFIDGSFNTPIGKVGAYAYLIDVDNNPNVGRSNTYGAFTNLGGLYLEAAYQEGDSNLAGGDGDYDAFLGRAHYTVKTPAGAFTIGADYMEENFKTPFQTAHAHFGFADAFLGQQIGLNNAGGNFTGIFDGYLKYAKTGLPGGLTFKAHLHYFANDDFSQTYGYEVDAVLVKKFNDNFTGLIKGAFFFADDDGGFSDINQVTLDLQYKF